MLSIVRRSLTTDNLVAFAVSMVLAAALITLDLLDIIHLVN